jgi:hypothetical protein
LTDEERKAMEQKRAEAKELVTLQARVTELSAKLSTVEEVRK